MTATGEELAPRSFLEPRVGARSEGGHASSNGEEAMGDRSKRDDITGVLEDADTLTDLSDVVPRELLEAARDEIVNPPDETDEG